jgi:hypothetical protein
VNIVEGKPQRPPRAVVTSVAIHATSQALGFICYAALGKYPHSFSAAITWLVAICVLYFYLRAIYAGYNWVRWLSVVLAAWGIAIIPWGLPYLGIQAAKVIYLAQQAVDATAAILLLLPSSARWYRSNYSFKADAHSRAA